MPKALSDENGIIKVQINNAHELKTRLVNLAKKEKRTLTMQVEMLIEEALQLRENQARQAVMFRENKEPYNV